MGISNTIQQLSVFLENREGRLDTVLKILAENDVNIVASASILSTVSKRPSLFGHRA